MVKQNLCRYSNQTCNIVCDDKKKRERHTIESFLNAIKLKATCIQCSESPDFLITSADGSKIGIELTEHLQRGSSGNGDRLRSFESRLDKLLNKIEDIIKSHPDSADLQHTSTSIGFIKKMLPEGTDLDTLAAELVSIAAVSITQPGDEIVVSSFGQYHLAAQYVKMVVFKPRQLFVSRWYCGEAMCDWIGLNTCHVRRILMSKTAKLSAYRNNTAVHDIWLVISSAISPYVSSFPPPVETVESFAHSQRHLLAASGFNQIWFYSCYGAVCMYPEIVVYPEIVMY